tara:strand:+ start:2852 stop:3064 length:213 start_codon:yes stop_codon:yes gene_type:complete
MYKITHKETGFTQYRNAKELADFVYKNKNTKYEIKEISEFDFTELQDALIALFLIIFVFVSAYFLLWIFY